MEIVDLRENCVVDSKVCNRLHQSLVFPAKTFMLLIKKAIQDFGGSPTATTPGTDAMALVSMGLVHVLDDPWTIVSQSFEAILFAELAERNSGKLLIAHGQEMIDQNLLAQFQRAMAEEETHVVEVRKLLKEMTMGKTRL
jgi:hypothetical protein